MRAISEVMMDCRETCDCNNLVPFSRSFIYEARMNDDEKNLIKDSFGIIDVSTHDS